MSLSQQAVYFVDHMYSIAPAVHTKHNFTGDDRDVSKVHEQDFEKSIPDSWDLSFDACSNHCHKPNAHDLPKTEISKPSLRARRTSSSSKSASDSSTSPNSAVLNDTPTTSESNDANAPELGDDQCKNPDLSGQTKTQIKSEKPVQCTPWMNFDTKAIFGDEDDEMEDIIEQEKRGAAWRNAPQVDLNELKNPFRHRNEASNRNKEEYMSESFVSNPRKLQPPPKVIATTPSSTKVFTGPREPISEEEGRKQVYAWAHKMNSSEASKIKNHRPDDLLREVVNYALFEHIHPKEAALYKESALPYGANGEFCPLPPYPRGAKGLKTWTDGDVPVMYWEPNGLGASEQIRKRHFDECKFFAPQPTPLWRVTNIDESLPDAIRPREEEPIKQYTASSSSEEEPQGSQSRSASPPSSFSKEEPRDAKCPAECPEDGRISRLETRETEHPLPQIEATGLAAEVHEELPNHKTEGAPVAENYPPMEEVPSTSPSGGDNVPYQYENYFQEAILDQLWIIESSSVSIAKQLATRAVGWLFGPL